MDSKKPELTSVVYGHALPRTKGNPNVPELAWLIGRRVKIIEKVDYTWSFTFDDGSGIATDGPWRFIAEECIIVTSEDHGHPFGLGVPVDACERTKAQIGEMPVERFEVDERTGDLSLFFSNATTIQFMQLSCGYENWRTYHGAQEIICMGGGSLATVNDKPT